MNPHCLIVHGCPANTESAKHAETRTYDRHWIPWITRELTARGIPTTAPLMPHPWEPVYEEYLGAFAEYPVSEETILVGHSGGTAFLVRWLGDTKQVIKQLVLVAPWNIERDDPIKKAFYDFPIDPGIRSRVGSIVYFTSDNEKDDGKTSLHSFHSALGGTVLSLPGHGHYTLTDMGSEAFPELIDRIAGKS